MRDLAKKLGILDNIEEFVKTMAVDDLIKGQILYLLAEATNATFDIAQTVSGDPLSIENVDYFGSLMRQLKNYAELAIQYHPGASLANHSTE